jgi:hypothetical protein
MIRKSATAAARLFLILSLGILQTAGLWAQSSNGSVRGAVQDATDAVIPNAAVSLTNVATGVELTTTSNETGFYIFPSVITGSYRLKVVAPGMQAFDAAVQVQTAQSTTVGVTLRPSGTQTLVQVDDIAPMLVTDNPTLGATLERTRIEELPINGRNLMSLLEVVPGLTFDSEGGYVRTFGARRGTHDVVVDGAALTEQISGGSIARPPSLDSIQEFRVDNNSASARYTRQTTIIVTTKSGSNAFHGTLFETNRNSGYGVARARDNMTNTAAKLNRNEFGGTAGGPIWIPKLYNGKNRSFWFFSYEGSKQRSGGYSNFAVPTQAMREGDFSGLINAAGTRSVIYDPLTTGADNRRQPFNYGGKLNQIDPSRISPLAKEIFRVYPLPNIDGANPLVSTNYNAAAAVVYDSFTITSRFDHRFTDKDLVYARLTWSEANNVAKAANGVPTVDGSFNTATTSNPNRTMALDWSRTFSPSFFNEVMFSATRTVGSTFNGDPSRRYASELGLPNPGGQPGYPRIDIGLSGMLGPDNWNMFFFNYFILQDNATKVHGKHEFQFGVHLRREQDAYTPQQQFTAGSITFPGVATALLDAVQSNATNRVATPNTGSALASAYLGYASYQVRAAKGRYYMRQAESSAYFQDNYRVTNRLTLNLGVRWQYTPYPSDKYGIFSGFDRKNMAIVLGQELDVLYKVGATSPALIKALQGYGAKFETWKDAGLPQSLGYNNWHDLGPHVGFAYRGLSGKRSFVLRGGFSTNYFTLPWYGWNDNTRQNTPFSALYSNTYLTDAAQSPDGRSNWGLTNVPTIIAGKNSTNAVNFDNPQGLSAGTNGSFAANYFDPHQPTSRVHDWNLTLGKELVRDTVLRVGYVGNHATQQDSFENWNKAIQPYVWYMTRQTQYPTGTAANVATRAANPYPYGDTKEYGKNGWGWSNGIQAEIQRRFSKGLGFQVMYTLMNTIKAAAHGWNADSGVNAASVFLPGSVPTDLQERIDFLLKTRDTSVPQHEIRWNWIAELPFGKGKPVFRSANRYLNAVVGGWQVTGMGRWKTNYFLLPIDGWPTGTPVEYYGHKYPIEDCRSGTCRPGYLLFNGYIPAHQINSYDARTGKPNGVMGVPSNYKPSTSPLWPYPADYLTRSAATDPNYTNYGTNFIYIPLKDQAQPVRVAYSAPDRASAAWSPVHPWTNQTVLATNLWRVDASIFKSFAIHERARLRVQFDFFNVFNTPGNAFAASSAGIVGTWYNMNGARTMQASARLNW